MLDVFEQNALTIADETPAEVMIYAGVANVDFIILNVMANAIKYAHPAGEGRCYLPYAILVTL